MTTVNRKCKIKTYFGDTTQGEDLEGRLTIDKGSISLSFKADGQMNEYKGHEIVSNGHYQLKGDWSHMPYMILHYLPDSKYLNGYFQEEAVDGMIRIELK